MRMIRSVLHTACCLVVTGMLGLFSSTVNAQSQAGLFENAVEGTWYLALDAEIFGLPPNSNLPGLVQFHSDRTMQVLDAGDLGAAPFSTRDTTQLGNWTRQHNGVLTRTLFLEVDGATGNALGWNMVRLTLSMPQGNMMEGHANVYFLECDQETPFPVFFCPDPVKDLNAFELLPPENIPVTLTRLPRP